MLIRPETPADFGAISSLVEEAFANHIHSKQTEHLIVDALRNAGALHLSLVAAEDGDIVGHIAFSPVKIAGVDCAWLGLGPVAVVPRRQRQGIGPALIERGLEDIQAMGACGCVLLGHPEYYRTFGFHALPQLTLMNVPVEYFLARSFIDQIPEGAVEFHDAFSLGLN